MKAIVHPEAHGEMIESARFYEGKSEGFGSDFLTAVEETTHRIEQFPEAAPIEKASIRQRLVSGFPSRFFTKYSLRASSSQPSCINIAGPDIGGAFADIKTKSCFRINKPQKANSTTQVRYYWNVFI